MFPNSAAQCNPVLPSHSAGLMAGSLSSLLQTRRSGRHRARPLFYLTLLSTSCYNRLGLGSFISEIRSVSSILLSREQRSPPWDQGKGPHKLHPLTPSLWCNVTSCNTFFLVLIFSICLHREERDSWKMYLDMNYRMQPLDYLQSKFTHAEQIETNCHNSAMKSPSIMSCPGGFWDTQKQTNKQNTPPKWHTQPSLERSLGFFGI